MLGRFFRRGKVRPGFFFPRGKSILVYFFRGRFYPGAVFPGGSSMRGETLCYNTGSERGDSVGFSTKPWRHGEHYYFDLFTAYLRWVLHTERSCLLMRIARTIVFGHCILIPLQPAHTSKSNWHLRRNSLCFTYAIYHLWYKSLMCFTKIKSLHQSNGL